MTRFYLTGQEKGESLRFDLRDGVQVLGRSSECDIPIPGSSVSKRHAKIEIIGDRVLVSDQGSKNGTLVNGQAVSDQTPIHHGDQLTIGHLSFHLQDTLSSESAQLVTDGEVRTPFTTSFVETWNAMEKGKPRRVLEAVHEAGQLLAERLEVHDLYERMLELVSRFIRADRLLVLSPDESAEGPAVLAYRGGAPTANHPLRMSKTLAREVLVEGRSLLTEDASADDRFAGTESIMITGIHSAMAAPLFDNGEILGMMYADSLSRAVVYTQEDLRLLTLLANMTAVKVRNNRLMEIERENERRKRELDVAARIQQNLLPREIPNPPGYEIFGHQTPCHEVGGDLYDVRPLSDGRIWLALGDVTGKGVGAAMLMSNVMAALRILEDETDNPLSLAKRLEDRLSQIVEVGQFVTFFVAILEPATGKLAYVNAGHNPPMILGASGVRELESTGAPLTLVPDFVSTAAEAAIDTGETLLIFSDGLSETTTNDVQYDEARLDTVLREPVSGAEQLGERLLEDVEAFRGDAPPLDDLTLLIVRRA